jgi:hypothetical protein
LLPETLLIGGTTSRPVLSMKPDQPASLVDEAPFVANADRSQPIREFAKTVVLRRDDYLSGFVDETPLSIL